MASPGPRGEYWGWAGGIDLYLAPTSQHGRAPMEGGGPPPGVAGLGSATDCFIEALRLIPPEAWERVVEREPEQGFLSLALRLHRWEEALSLTLIAGLNDYQLRCRAEECYWPPLERVLRQAGGDYKAALQGMMEFYKSQPLGGQKLARMRRLLRSRLHWEILTGQWSPQRLARELGVLHRRLGEAMGQRPEAKTIAFAAKLAAMLARLAGAGGVEVELPMPVDRRVEALSLCLEGRKMDADSIRQLWSRLLRELKTAHPSLTMVELDSLAWQLAARLRGGAGDITEYFRELGAPRVGESVARCLGHCAGRGP